MLGTRRDLVPVVPVEQRIAGAGIHGLPYAFFERLLDGTGGDQFVGFSLGDKWLQERTLLVLGERGVLPSAVPIFLNTGLPQSVLPGHGVMDEPA
jgi:hypothetical protein